MKKLLYFCCLLLAVSMTSCIFDFSSSTNESEEGDFSLEDAVGILSNVIDYNESRNPDDPDLLDPNHYCWEITMTATKDGETGTEIEHQWATGAEIIAFFEMVQYKLEDEAPGATLEVKFKKMDRSEEDCRK
ncbi:MAG: hypothetical protein UHZ06_03450 [Paludibacteraceae bacterium]|nr:hypothetical protein [Paludibacteraceae bacterium]